MNISFYVIVFVYIYKIMFITQNGTILERKGLVQERIGIIIVLQNVK